MGSTHRAKRNRLRPEVSYDTSLCLSESYVAQAALASDDPTSWWSSEYWSTIYEHKQAVPAFLHQTTRQDATNLSTSKAWRYELCSDRLGPARPLAVSSLIVVYCSTLLPMHAQRPYGTKRIIRIWLRSAIVICFDTVLARENIPNDISVRYLFNYSHLRPSYY